MEKNIHPSAPLPLLVLTNLPDQASAGKLGRELVERKLAACVNILSSCTSIYHWKGQLETSQEIPMFIKTSTTAYPALEEAIRDLHPYELPEIVQVPISGGLPAYIQWLMTEIPS